MSRLKLRVRLFDIYFRVFFILKLCFVAFLNKHMIYKHGGRVCKMKQFQVLSTYAKP